MIIKPHYFLICLIFICTLLLLCSRTFAEIIESPNSSETKTYSFDIPSQDITRTLIDLARTVSITLIFDSKLVKALKVPEIKGEFTLEEAAAKILRGTEYQLIRNEKRLDLVRKAKAKPPSEDGFVPHPPFEEVYVAGYRSSYDTSLNLKRMNANIIDAVTAVDIGKLPDVTISDSLQRIAGIQIGRSGGEGAEVTIRESGLVMTTLNGELMISPHSLIDTQANFLDVPATLVSSIEVVKSPEANSIIGGITGNINLNTIRPLHLRDGATVTSQLSLINGSLSDENDPNVSVFAGWNAHEKWGVSMNLSYSDLNLVGAATGGSDVENAFVTGETIFGDVYTYDTNRDAHIENGEIIDDDDFYFVFPGHEAERFHIKRQRLGINNSFQYRFNTKFTLLTDVFYTRLNDKHNAMMFTIEQAGDWFESKPWFELNANGTRAYRNVIKAFNDAGRLVPRVAEGNIVTIHDAIWQTVNTSSNSETTVSDNSSLNMNIELRYDNNEWFYGSLRFIHGEGQAQKSHTAITTYINSESAFPNPSGYQGIPATLSVATIENANSLTWMDMESDFKQIPVGIRYTNNKQIWLLPVFDSDGKLLLTQDGRSAFEGDDNLVVDAGSVDVFGSNLMRYGPLSHDLNGNSEKADMNVIRGDASIEFGDEFFQSLDFGWRYSKRRVKQTNWRAMSFVEDSEGNRLLAPRTSPRFRSPITNESVLVPVHFYDELLEGKAVQIDDFPGTQGLGAPWFIHPNHLEDPEKFYKLLYGDYVKIFDPDYDYLFRESLNAFYSQINFEYQSLALAGNIGFRLIETDIKIRRNRTIDTNSYTVDTDSESVEYLSTIDIRKISHTYDNNRRYTHLLPTFNLTVDLTPKQKIRFAHSKNISDLGTLTLAGGIHAKSGQNCNAIDPDCTRYALAVGNPNLKPLQSTNYETSWEWYFSDNSILSLNYFNYKINSKLQRKTYEDEAVPGVSTRGFINVPVDHKITGWELALQFSAADYIHSEWLSGFGWGLNYTVSSDTRARYTSDPIFDLTDYRGKGLPPKLRSANAILWYEKYGFQGRIALNYTGKRLRHHTQYSFEHGYWNLPGMTKPRRYIDAALSYALTDTVTFFLEAANLTEEKIENYNQWESLLEKRWLSERRVSLGAQIHF